MPAMLVALVIGFVGPTSGGPNLPQLLVEHPVGVVRSGGVAVLRDFSNSRDLLELPSTGKKIAGYTSFNLAYDARAHELFVIRSGLNSPAMLYRCIVPADGSNPHWKGRSLPPRSSVLMGSTQGEEYARADAAGVTFNQQYVFVVYDGPR